MNIQLTNFSKRHFDKSFVGTKITDISEKAFEMHINSMFKSALFLEGYAPFCKLMVIHNGTNAKTGTMELTLETLPYLKSGYSARTEEELPVLSRWLEIPSQFVPIAKYLVIVLYDYKQLLEENKSKEEEFELNLDTDYGVVAILGQMTDSEEPMKPMTMIRNSMGIEHGGSGSKLDEKKYRESIKFWETYSTIK